MLFIQQANDDDGVHHDGYAGIHAYDEALFHPNARFWAQVQRNQ